MPTIPLALDAHPPVMLLSHNLMKSSIKNLAAFSADILTSVTVCDGSLESQEADTEESLAPNVELFQVRRRSSRNLQLPPLVFRLAEQHDWNSKESESIARPTTLALRTTPVIAITSADASRCEVVALMSQVFLLLSSC
ncbi:hypothetical protein E1301_Tti000105 [Triplophysa tibetana]|uniref:Uncharacterized protein n=1 Tax=Triplophysa tibetana TaxID=1572043 RepID=A0A5A9N2I1_9TELE|nr:hypothetical protein E1301_Tti000105 [Triplophysa tibetana]